MKVPLLLACLVAIPAMGDHVVSGSGKNAGPAGRAARFLTPAEICEIYRERMKAQDDLRLPDFLPQSVAAEAPKKKADFQPGHSMQGEAFNDGPRQRGRFVDGTGKIDFPVTTKSAAAQRWFTQGVGQLHGFQFLEAERSFREALLADPNLLMAYWGLGMATRPNRFYAGNRERLAGFYEKGLEVAKTSDATPREREWFASLSAIVDAKKGDDSKGRDELMVRLAKLGEGNSPDALEARAFLALVWVDGSKRSDDEWRRLTDGIFRENADHPVHHANIHYWDGTGKGGESVERSVQRSGPSAPGIAHMWHMPAHILEPRGNIAEALWHLEAAARKDNAYMEEHKLLPSQIHNFPHNADWIAKSLAKVGRIDEAIQMNLNILSMPTLKSSGYLNGTFLDDVAARKRILNLLVDTGNSKRLLAWEPGISPIPSHTPIDDVDVLRRFGLAAIAESNRPALARYLEILGCLQRMSKDARPHTYDAATIALLQLQVTKLGTPMAKQSSVVVQNPPNGKADMKSFGPLLWQPYKAPDFEVKGVDMSGYRLVIMNLGKGCAHCNDQLHALAKIESGKQSFRELGVRVLTVTNDSEKSLGDLATVIRENNGGTLPFLLTRDATPQLPLFRAFRAMDEFENRPLHGMFLLDPQGRVRWQEVGSEPYMDFSYLRAEFLRLRDIAFDFRD